MIKALIFDFNGVIVDDEPIHCALFRKVLAEEGIALTQKDYYRLYLGMNDKDCFKAVLTGARRDASARVLAGLIERKARYYRDTIARRLIFFPGARAFIRRVARTYPLAIVSGALRSEIETILRSGKIARCFSVVVAAEDVRNGKPHPAGFLKALTMLRRTVSMRLKAKECLVLEDSLEGIAAAKKAGMHCLALATSHPESKLCGADLVVKGYAPLREALWSRL